MEVVFDILVDVMDCQHAPASDQQEVADLRGAESTKSVHGVKLACLKIGESLDFVPLVDLAEMSTHVFDRVTGENTDGVEDMVVRLKGVRGDGRPILISILKLPLSSSILRIVRIFACVVSRPSVVLSLRISQLEGLVC